MLRHCFSDSPKPPPAAAAAPPPGSRLSRCSREEECPNEAEPFRHAASNPPLRHLVGGAAAADDPAAGERRGDTECARRAPARSMGRGTASARTTKIGLLLSEWWVGVCGVAVAGDEASTIERLVWRGKEDSFELFGEPV